jgi:hypothetical protein
MRDESFCYFCCINVRRFLSTVLILYRSSPLKSHLRRMKLKYALSSPAHSRASRHNINPFERRKIGSKVFRIEFSFSAIKEITARNI